MGYHTDFQGEAVISPALKPEHAAYLIKFGKTRRMRRDSGLIASQPDPLREAVGLPVGEEGEYFVGEEEWVSRGFGIIDANKPPKNQPGLWCSWHVIPNDNGDWVLCWSGMEKFYYYTEWLQYLIDHFFGPWGYRLNGDISWSGEDVKDVGRIHIQDNQITLHTLRCAPEQASFNEQRRILGSFAEKTELLQEMAVLCDAAMDKGKFKPDLGEINLNDYVSFVLTKYGADVWNQWYADLDLESPGLQDGSYTDQLWRVMNILGPKMYAGARQVIEGNVIRLVDRG